MRTRTIIAALALCVAAASCRNTPGKSSGAGRGNSGPLSAAIPVIDTMRVQPPFRLCVQELTGKEYIMNRLGPFEDNYDMEYTPAEDAFFVPEPDIRDDGTCRTLALRYNFVAVMNRVVHAYELYCRKLPVEDTLMTRRDTLDIIAHDRPEYRKSGLGKYIADPATLKEAEKFLAVYGRFDGNEEPLGEAFGRFNEHFSTLPVLASEELLDEFGEHFWEWYDKRRHVPEIDDIIALRVNGSDTRLSQEQYDRLTDAMYGETDIDRRAILAIEAAHHADGILQLGEIIEAGIYTKYLLEVWLLWRAQVQMKAIGPSSFCMIPNNYYDRMRVKCMNTILRHMQTGPDRYDACLLENFIGVQVLHRQASIAGNESLAILASMKSGQFVDPRLLK